MNGFPRRSTATILGVTALAINATANYPINPVPLRRLIENAEFIGVVKVVRVTGARCGPNACTTKPSGQETAEAAGLSVATRPADGGKYSIYQTAVATLAIETVLKGNAPPGNTLAVPFEGTVICPAPPRYVAGETLVVFLRYKRDYGGWNTCSLSHGTIVLDSAEKKDRYVAAVREMLDIEKIADPTEKRAQTIEWLVKCVESPHTRWHGLCELVPTDVDEMRPYFNRIKDAVARGDEHTARYIREWFGNETFLSDATLDQRKRLYKVALSGELNEIDRAELLDALSL